MKKIALFVLFLLIFSSSNSYSDELGDLLSGFDEEETAEPSDLDLLEGGFEENAEQTVSRTDETQPVMPQWLELQGSISLQSSYNFSHDGPEPGQPDYRGLSMLRTRAELIGDILLGNWTGRAGIKGFYDFSYELSNERELYSSAMLDEYEDDIEITDLYLQGSLTDQLDLKVGRQVVVWGKSDNIRITDVLNPIDLRQPGMADIRDIRLPVTMTRLDYYTGDWGITGLVIHEPEFNKTPVYNSDFYPGNQPTPRTTDDSWSLDNQQFGFAANGIFSGWDFSYYLAYVYQQNPYIKTTENSTVLARERSLMTGVAANIALGNYLIKAEIAYWDDLNYSALPGDEKSRIDSMIGVEYSGINEATVSLEFANYHILDFDKRLESAPDYLEENQYQYAIRYVHDFMHDTLHLTILASIYGIDFDGGSFERLQLEYEIDDAVSVTGGVIFYQSGDYLMFSDVEDNDRLFFELEYRF